MDAYDYRMPRAGLGTDFSEYERPQDFAKVYTNRFRNVTGNAEKRPGMTRLTAAVSGEPTLTRLHEHVSNSGVATLLTSDDLGNIYRFDAATSAFTTARTGGSFSRYISVQAEDKLILVNGIDRNIYTDDGGVTFNELKPLITRGTLAGGTTTSAAVDGDISNWIGATLVSNNDILHNITNGGYAIITAVNSASLGHTSINPNANGLGIVSVGQQSGDLYEILDHVDLNIIPQGGGLYDNVATAGAGTTNLVIAVSGVDFSTTEIRPGDIVYNTTREHPTFVSVVSANINLSPQMVGQSPGDALVFFKSAMPIASNIHVHYGRVYMVDARNKTRVVITAPDDPQDVTTFAKTLDSTSFSFGTQQPHGDTIDAMGTFQSYFVAAGRRNVFIYKGNTPIQDASATTLDFEPIAAYPAGLSSRFSMGVNGSDLLYIADDGLQAISIGNISNTTIHNNAAAPIRNEMSRLIKSVAADDVQLTFYPTRTWLICKVGTNCYILNNSPVYTDSGEPVNVPAWHLFSGQWAQRKHYFVRRSGELLGCGAGGLVHYLDNGAATDDGSLIPTEISTAWLRLEEPAKTVRVKQGQYIKPVFESAASLEYTINAVAGYEQFSSDTIVVSAGGAGAIGSSIIGTTPIGGGSFAQATKHPLRWRGEQVRVKITTNSSISPDIITGFTLYGEIVGVR